MRLSLAVFAAALATYGFAALPVRADARFTELGMRDEYAFVLRDADRAVHGPRPVVWLVGSSVVREAFDADGAEEALRARGVDVDVQKFAFNRGTPLFTRALLRHLPIQPGDTVITSVAEDNFTRGWLHEVDDLDGPARVLLDPVDAVSLPDLTVQERTDLLLAMLPPRDFGRHRDEFQRGLFEWATARVQGRAPRAKTNVPYQPFTRGAVQTLYPPDQLERRVVTDDLLALDPSQENWAALHGWIADVRALGAAPVLLRVPHHPDYGRHFASPAVTERFLTAIREVDAPLWELQAAGRDDYADWNHPNDAGRAHYTAALVQRLTPPP